MTLPYALKYCDDSNEEVFGYIASIDSIAMARETDFVIDKFKLIKCSRRELLIFITGHLEASDGESNGHIIDFVSNELKEISNESPHEIAEKIDSKLEKLTIDKDGGTIFLFVSLLDKFSVTCMHINYGSNTVKGKRIIENKEGIPYCTFAPSDRNLVPQRENLLSFWENDFSNKAIQKLPSESIAKLRRIQISDSAAKFDSDRNSKIRSVRNLQELTVTFAENSELFEARPFTLRPIRYFDVTPKGIFELTFKANI